MARVLILLTAALAAASCATRDGDVDEPAWLSERIREADAATTGYPPLSDFPRYVPKTRSLSEWRRGLSEMEAIRDDVLSDPAMEDPDAADAADFARQSRAETARDVERQRVDD